MAARFFFMFWSQKLINTFIFSNNHQCNLLKLRLGNYSLIFMSPSATNCLIIHCRVTAIYRPTLQKIKRQLKINLGKLSGDVHGDRNIRVYVGLTEYIAHTVCRVQLPYCKTVFKTNNVLVFPVDGILVCSL